MKRIAVLFAFGTEEIEGITPVDILRRAGAECDIVSVSGKTIVGSHGIQIIADKLIEDIDADDYDGVVIARRDSSSTTTKITPKYTEILYFPIVFPHFVFVEDADGYKQKVLKKHATVHIVVNLVTGNTRTKN